MNTTATVSSNARVWSKEEHDRFLVALRMYPRGPWQRIADQVRTRSARQAQTHAQKYYEKVERRLRGLRKDRINVVRVEHRIDYDIVKFCESAKSTETGSRKPLGSFLAQRMSKTDI
ncbi:Myb-like dna-binding protein, partial [Globisporangium splendens]